MDKSFREKMSISLFFDKLLSVYVKIRVDGPITNRGLEISIENIGKKSQRKTRESDIKKGIAIIAKSCDWSVSKRQVKSLLRSSRKKEGYFIRVPFSTPEIIEKITIEHCPLGDDAYDKEAEEIPIVNIDCVKMLIWRFYSDMQHSKKKIPSNKYASMMKKARR